MTEDVGRRQIIKGAAIVGASGVTLPAFAQDSRETTPLHSDLTADELLKLLQLEANATCGFVRVSFVSKHSIGKGGLPAAV